MLAFDPTQRQSIVEIITNPWFVGQTSTSQEIYEEFKARKTKVDEAVEKERIAEQQKKEQQKMAAKNQNPNFMFNAIGPAFRSNHKKNRTEEDEMEQEANEKLWNKVQAKMADMSLTEDYHFILRPKENQVLVIGVVFHPNLYLKHVSMFQKKLVTLLVHTWEKINSMLQKHLTKVN